MLDKIPRSHLYATATIILWSYAYVGSRMIMLEQSMGPAELGFIRNFIAMLIFVAILLLKRIGLPPLRDVPIFLLAGFLGFALYMYIFTKGLETISGGTSAILLSTIPLFSAALSSVIFKEKVSPLGWIALFVSFTGTAILSLWNGAFSVSIGVAWTLAAAVSMSFYNILQRYLSRRAARPYSSLQITSYSFIAAVLMSAFLLPSSFRQFAAAPAASRWVVLMLGIFPSALAFLCWSKAISVAKSLGSVVSYMFLVPFAALIACFFALGELPDAGALVGGAVILFGIALFNAAMRRQERQIIKIQNPQSSMEQRG